MAAVLIVDDERQVLESLLVLVRSRSAHHVATAATAKQARELAEAQTFDLLIVDLLLADDVDGLELANTLRESNPRLPVIVVTGYVSDDLQDRVGSLLRTWVLPKPCGFNEFMQTIEFALQSNNE